MRRVVTLAAAAVMLGAAALTAQTANFSGTWTRDTTGMGAMGGGGGRGGGGGPMTIAQSAATLTITRSMGGNDVKSVYNLDGSDSKNTTQGRGGPVESTSNAKWTGASLTIVTKTTAADGTARIVTTVYALDATGHVLSVSTTQPPRGGGDPTTNTVKYNKS